MSDVIKEITTGPVTLLVYLLVIIGGAVVLFGDAIALNNYFALLDKLDVPIAGLAAGRGIAVAGKHVNKPPADPPASPPQTAVG